MSKPLFSKRQRLLFNWGIISLLAVVVLVLIYLIIPAPVDPATFNPANNEIINRLSNKAPIGAVPFKFSNELEAAGISFQHFPATRNSLLPEDMGSGLAWGDYDNDGDADLLLVNFYGSILEPIPDNAVKGKHALYRNDSNGKFTEVAEAAGLKQASFGLAAAWGDYDNDSDLDLYITNYGANQLYRNNGDGTFTDVTSHALVGDTSFSTGCVWGDYDNDGNIDLYVANYVEFDYRATDVEQASNQYGSEIPYTINPSSYSAVSNRLYRNLGDGTFVDVAEAAGVANPEGRSLGAVWFDFDNDGLIDLYVANDISNNGVYHNLGDGTFADIGASSLAADYRGAMGLAVGDYEHDGDFDLFVTHWLAQENAFFENMLVGGFNDAEGKPSLFFTDGADMLGGLGQISLKMVGWATGFADFDNDGFLDLWVVNGDTLEVAGDNTRLKPQMMHIFHQQPGQGFFEVGKQAAQVLSKALVGRGGAHADYDGDGKMDIAVMVHSGHPLLLHNTSTDSGHWVAVRLRQIGGNTHALGARVAIRVDTEIQTAQVGTEGSYLSQHSSDLHFGLGTATLVDEITIYWPDGVVEKQADLEVDRVVRFEHVAEYK